MTVERFAALALGVTLLLSGCGGDELSLTEYVEQLNAIMLPTLQEGTEFVASPEGAVLFAEREHLDDYTPQDLQVALIRVGEIEVEVREATSAIDPPEEIAHLHDLLFDTRFAMARAALAIRAGTAADWEELSETPEMAAYRAAVLLDKSTCLEFQAELDATAERGVFADTPWVPGELKEVVEAVLGCDTYPENPGDMFRPLPTVTP